MPKIFVYSTLADNEFQNLAEQVKSLQNQEQFIELVLLDGCSDKSQSLSVLESYVGQAFVLVVDSIVQINFEAINEQLVNELVGDNFDIAYFDSSVKTGFRSKVDILRPDFSKERLLNQYYLGPVVLLSREFFISLSRDIPLEQSFFSRAVVLAGIEQQKVIRHIKIGGYVQFPEVVPSGYPVALAPYLQKAVTATGGGEVIINDARDQVFPKRTVRGNPLVSIVIPSRGHFIEKNGDEISLLINCLTSIFDLTIYKNFEVVVVLDSDSDPKVLKWLRNEKSPQHPISIIAWDKPFNFSEKMNLGVTHASGDYVLLLNDDVEVISPNWISSMLSLAQLPGAGMVGAMLYYDDSTIQHAGHAYFEGSPTHIGLGLVKGSTGPMDSLRLVREVSGVTAACSLMPKKAFMEVGGFTSLLPGNFNDVDLCLKTRWRGFDIYWTPDAELYHYESKTRDAHVHFYELDIIEKRWGLQLDDKRYWPWLPNAQK